MSTKATQKKVSNKKVAVEQSESKALVRITVKKRGRKPAVITETKAYESLLDECKRLMEHTEQTMIQNYWKLGQLVNKLRGTQRFTYGNKTVLHLSEDLGKDPTTLYRAGRFAEIYKEKELLPRGSNLTWGHMKVILSVEDAKKREEFREKVEKQSLTIKDLIAEIQGTVQRKPKALKASTFDSFLNRATRLYSFISESNIEGFEPGEVDKTRVKELEDLYKKIGEILKKIK